MNNVRQIQNYINRTRNLYFIRSVLQGLLYLFIFSLAAFFILILTDIAIHFNQFYLTIIHFSFFVIIGSLILYYLGKPFYYWVINKSEYDQYWFARQIGNAENRIDDKLLNILELYNASGHNELVLASIDQKVAQVNLNKIEQFFSFKTLLKQIYIFLGIVLLLSLMAFINPESFNYSSQRLFPINNENKSLPYTIVLENDLLEVDKGDDFYLKAKVEGMHRPENLYIDIGGEHFFMNDSANYFIYNIDNIRQDISFRLTNDIYNSQVYTIKCIPVPILKAFQLEVVPPKYTFIDKFTIQGSGNVTYPYGSKLTWNIRTIDTDSLFLHTDSIISLTYLNNGEYTYQSTFFKDFNYAVILKNLFRNKIDSVEFSAKAIPDQYPNIKLNSSKIDLLGNFTFEGEISDDYGFHSFDFILKYGDEELVKNIPMISSSVSQAFQYSGSLRDYESIIQSKDVEISLRLKDNDPFYPHKEVFSQTLYGKLPSKGKLSQLEEAKITTLKDKLSLGTQLLEQLNKEKNNIRKKLLAENSSKWEKQQLSDQLKQANEDLKQLSEQINKLREDLKELGSFDQKENLRSKQQQLEELLQKLMDDELKELMKQLEKLQNEILNKENPRLDDVDLSMDDLEKHLDQNLEMLKRYEVEKKQDELIDKIRELGDKLNDSTSAISNDELEKLKDQIDSTFNQHDENLKKNKQLQDPYNLDDFKKEKENIQQKSDQLESSDDLSDEEKNPGDDLQELANQMEMNMNAAMQQQQGEDAAMIRDLLENLLLFSFIQENYIEQFNNQDQYNLNELKRNQLDLKERFNSLEDSLNALMSRNAMVALSIGNQITNINQNFGLIKESFQAERFKSIQVNQQIIMQSVNELILLLNESLDQMNSMSGIGGNCKKQGKQSKPGMSGMKKKQQSMKKSLQQMIDQLKKGSKPGQGQKSMSEQLSKMLGEQEKLQQMLQQMMQSGEVGQTTRQILQEINEMVDKNIDDIIKRNINDNIVRRQNQILTRMLEAEKAEEEREKDKKREAEKPNIYEISNPEDIFQYKEEHKTQKGILNKQKLPLKYFFQRKYDKYLNDVENN